jgi:hypothetical protein
VRKNMGSLYIPSQGDYFEGDVRRSWTSPGTFQQLCPSIPARFVLQARMNMSHVTGCLNIRPTGQHLQPTYSYSWCIHKSSLFFIQVTCVHVQKSVSSRIRRTGFSRLKMTSSCGELRYNSMKCISSFNVIRQLKTQTRN